MMAELRNIPIDLLLPNPHRDLVTFPLGEDKVARLVASINEVGFWEGVLARPQGGKFQIAFGHHRIEAGRRAGLAEIPIIVRDIDDVKMLQFMKNENDNDYDAHFFRYLEVWIAAEKHLARQGLPANSQANGSGGHNRTAQRNVAEFLGWIDITSNGMTHQARVCAKAHEVITAQPDRIEIFRECTKIYHADQAIVRLNAPRPDEVGPTTAARQRAAERAEPVAIPEPIYPPHPTPQPSIGVVRNPPIVEDDPEEEEPTRATRHYHNRDGLVNFTEYTGRIISKLQETLRYDLVATELQAMEELLPTLEGETVNERLHKIHQEINNVAHRAANLRDRFSRTYHDWQIRHIQRSSSDNPGSRNLLQQITNES
jgi:hypothetical protein